MRAAQDLQYNGSTQDQVDSKFTLLRLPCRNKHQDSLGDPDPDPVPRLPSMHKTKVEASNSRQAYRHEQHIRTETQDGNRLVFKI